MMTTSTTNDHSFRRRRKVAFLLVPALLSLVSIQRMPTTSAFLQATNQNQCYYSSTTSLFYSSSLILKTESEIDPKICNDGSSDCLVSSVTLRSEGADKESSLSSKNKNYRRRHDPNKHSENPICDWLKEQGLPRGLRNALLDNIQEVSSKRIWIVDNSGSMKLMDGHGMSCNGKDAGSKQQTPSKDHDDDKVLIPRAGLVVNDAADGETSRWTELTETINFHAKLHSTIGAPTEFRFLNKPSSGGPQNFRVGYENQHIHKQQQQQQQNNNHNNFQVFPNLGPLMKRLASKDKGDCKRAVKIMNRNKPKGQTPLHEAVFDVKKDIVRMLPQLVADGMRVTLVICTDGFATSNEELEEAIDSLYGLPVNVVIRLCTDYGDVLNFYNGLDQRNADPSASFLDVLDDYEAEAAQVYGYNPWLNYALVLHQMREMGLQGSIGLLDMLDQKSFSVDEIRDFCAHLFGTTADLLPDPLCDWENFVQAVDRLQRKEQNHWNPALQAETPWIDVDELMAIQ